jgi:hypothetical protein
VKLASRCMSLVACLLALGACGSAKKPDAKTAADRAATLDSKGSGGERCQGGAGREVSEYDTSGDGRPDVRKVFVPLGSGVDARLVMICRESDVNSDGRKDVIRYYDDEGRTLREESDRDFDGKMDLILVFQDGKVVREELDENRDGKVDTKLFLEDGKISRAERDLKGRSTADQWHPDRWEYYEQGRMVRMGTDLDGDSRVDRWDRDADYKRPEDQQEDQKEQLDAASQSQPQSDAATASKGDNKSQAAKSTP